MWRNPWPTCEVEKLRKAESLLVRLESGVLVALLAAIGTPIYALMGGLALWLFHASGVDASA